MVFIFYLFSPDQISVYTCKLMVGFIDAIKTDGLTH